MDNFKRRGLNFKHGVELRAHRRSVEQKASRDRVLAERRLAVLSPLMEEAPAAPAAEQVPAPIASRREALKKYKERKDLEKKLEAQKKAAKPAFKVQIFKPTVPSFLVSKDGQNKKTQTKISEKGESATAVLQKPFTRSMAKQAVAGPSKPAGPGNYFENRTTRQAIASAAASKAVPAEVVARGGSVRTRNQKGKESARQAIHVTKEPTPTAPIEASVFKKPELPVFSKSTTNTSLMSVVTPSTDSHSHRRSFAPENFQFVAPVGVASVNSSSSSAATAEPAVGQQATTPCRPPTVPSAAFNSTNGSPVLLTLPRQLIVPVVTPAFSPAAGAAADDGSVTEPPMLRSPSLRRSSRVLTPLPNVAAAVVQPTSGKGPGGRFVRVSIAHPVGPENRRMTADLSTAYFRNLLLDETRKLEQLCAAWETIKGSDEALIGDDGCKSILSTVGMSRLLIRQRFHQFSELIDDCEFGRGEKPTTCVDLQGFWDMIHFQVDDVTTKFAKLSSMKEKNWTDIENTPKKIIPKKTVAPRRPTTKPSMSKNNEQAQAAKLRVAEARAKAKAALTARAAEATENPIFWSMPATTSADSSTDIATVVFPELPAPVEAGSQQQPVRSSPAAPQQDDSDDGGFDPKYFEPAKPQRKSRRSSSASDLIQSPKYRASVSPTTSVLRLMQQEMPQSTRRKSLRRSILENSLMHSNSVFSPLIANSVRKSSSSQNLMKFSLSPAQPVADGKENVAIVINSLGIFSP